MPSYSQQADVWFSVVKGLRYSRILLIHSSDSDGRSFQARLRYLIKSSTSNDNAGEDDDIKVRNISVHCKMTNILSIVNFIF